MAESLCKCRKKNLDHFKIGPVGSANSFLNGKMGAGRYSDNPSERPQAQFLENGRKIATTFCFNGRNG